MGQLIEGPPQAQGWGQRPSAAEGRYLGACAVIVQRMACISRGAKGTKNPRKPYLVSRVDACRVFQMLVHFLPVQSTFYTKQVRPESYSVIR